MDYTSNAPQINILSINTKSINTKSIPIPIIDSPQTSGKHNNTNNYQYNETSFDPCSGSPPNTNDFINKLEHRYGKLK
jgi:hypothetical protein